MTPRRLLILSIVYEPDTVSTATIVAGLARELHGLGHDVHVVSSVPHWNHAVGRPGRSVTTLERGVRVTRCYSPQRRASLPRRVVALAILHAGLLVQLLRQRDRDVVLVVSPPLTFAFLAFLHRLLWRSKVVYNAQELWPDVPRDLGIITNRFLLAALARMERRIYRSADAVVAIGEHFATAVTARGARSDRVAIIPNFVDLEAISPTAKDNALAQEWGLSTTPVLLYAGNIGLTQDWTLLFDAAERLPEATVLIVGDGAGRAVVEAEIRRRQLTNVRRNTFVDRSRVSELYGLSDVVLVPLGAAHGRSTVPSKIYSAMAAERPILATALDDTDLTLEVRQASAGVVVAPGDVSAFVAAALRLLAGDDVRFNAEAAAAAARQRTLETSGRAYDQLLRRLG